jgi:hypothetical protein
MNRPGEAAVPIASQTKKKKKAKTPFLTVGVLVRVRTRFSFVHISRTGSGVLISSYLMGTNGGGVKRPGYEADHLPPTSTDAKNT